MNALEKESTKNRVNGSSNSTIIRKEVNVREIPPNAARSKLIMFDFFPAIWSLFMTFDTD